MIEQRYPACGISSALRLKGKYDCKTGQVSSFVFFPDWVIGLSIESRKSFGAKGTQYLQGRIFQEYHRFRKFLDIVISDMESDTPEMHSNRR